MYLQQRDATAVTSRQHVRHKQPFNHSIWRRACMGAANRGSLQTRQCPAACPLTRVTPNGNELQKPDQGKGSVPLSDGGTNACSGLYLVSKRSDLSFVARGTTASPSQKSNRDVFADQDLFMMLRMRPSARDVHHATVLVRKEGRRVGPGGGSATVADQPDDPRVSFPTNPKGNRYGLSTAGMTVVPLGLRVKPSRPT